MDRPVGGRTVAWKGRHKGVARLLTVAIVIAAAIALPLSLRASESHGASNPATGPAEQVNSVVATGPRTVIALNPSHQDDTGTDGWHEYAVCGDIAKRATALLPDFTNVLAWETGEGLTSKNETSLKSECDQANAAHAQVFIAIHVNGGNSSGVAGVYHTGDAASAAYAEAVLRSVAAAMDMTFHYVRPRADLYVLDPVYNHAPIRILLELGDNLADRALLTSEEGRQKLAAALAEAVNQNMPCAFRFEQADARLAYKGIWTVGSNTSASSGSFRFANTPGASVTATFTGTGLVWIAKKSPSYGKAKVTVDGGDPVVVDGGDSVVVDLYSATTLYEQDVWQTGTLAPGTHTVKIEWTGTKNAAASGTNISLDAFEVTGALR